METKTVINATKGKKYTYNAKTNELISVSSISGDWETESVIQQHYEDDTDINRIMKKHLSDRNQIREGGKRGQFLDLTTMPDYTEGLLQIKKADEAFASLPSSERERFQNDPAKFLDYLADKKNVEEHYEKGYRVRPQPLNDDKTTKKAVKDPDPKNENT